MQRRARILEGRHVRLDVRPVAQDLAQRLSVALLTRDVRRGALGCIGPQAGHTGSQAGHTGSQAGHTGCTGLQAGVSRAAGRHLLAHALVDDRAVRLQQRRHAARVARAGRLVERRELVGVAV